MALIVKADDLGVAMAQSGLAAVRLSGRGLVLFMPVFLATLAAVGTAAMLWVGGGILVHGLEEFGFALPAHLIHDLAAAAGSVVPAGGIVAWLVGALGAGVAGLFAGALMIPLVSRVLIPAWSRMRSLWD